MDGYRLVFTLVLLSISLIPSLSAHKKRRNPEDLTPDFFSDENTKDTDHIQHHIKEDLKIKVDVEKMSDEQKDFYYFRLHDTDNNSILDGLEILKGSIHSYVDYMEKRKNAEMDGKAETDLPEVIERMTRFIDSWLKEYDTNFDGYINYVEYSQIRQAVSKNKET